jgi:hypothetical protein
MPDWTTVIASVLASTVLTSIVTGIIGPKINWGIEKKRLKRAYREAQIQKWRQMLHDVTLKLDEIKRGEAPRPANARSPEAFFLEKHPDFPSLMSVLPKGEPYEIFGSMTIHVGRTLPHALIYLEAV